MITSVYKAIHPQTGIISILINTENKWVEYQINRLSEEHKIVMSFYRGDNINPIEDIEYIDMKDDFDPFRYMIYHFQEKDQITLFLVPRTMLLDRKQWVEYGETTIKATT